MKLVCHCGNGTQHLIPHALGHLEMLVQTLNHLLYGVHMLLL